MKENRTFGKAPCNITKNNTIGIDLDTNEIVYVKYKCGKIKWKDRNGKK